MSSSALFQSSSFTAGIPVGGASGPAAAHPGLAQPWPPHHAQHLDPRMSAGTLDSHQHHQQRQQQHQQQHVLQQDHQHNAPTQAGLTHRYRRRTHSQHDVPTQHCAQPDSLRYSQTQHASATDLTSMHTCTPSGTGSLRAGSFGYPQKRPRPPVQNTANTSPRPLSASHSLADLRRLSLNSRGTTCDAEEDEKYGEDLHGSGVVSLATSQRASQDGGPWYSRDVMGSMRSRRDSGSERASEHRGTVSRTAYLSYIQCIAKQAASSLAEANHVVSTEKLALAQLLHTYDVLQKKVAMKEERVRLAEAHNALLQTEHQSMQRSGGVGGGCSATHSAHSGGPGVRTCEINHAIPLQRVSSQWHQSSKDASASGFAQATHIAPVSSRQLQQPAALPANAVDWRTNPVSLSASTGVSMAETGRCMDATGLPGLPAQDAAVMHAHGGALQAAQQQPGCHQQHPLFARHEGQALSGQLPAGALPAGIPAASWQKWTSLGVGAVKVHPQPKHPTAFRSRLG